MFAQQYHQYTGSLEVKKYYQHMENNIIKAVVSAYAFLGVGNDRFHTECTLTFPR
jgi:hypothetical protein